MEKYRRKFFLKFGIIRNLKNIVAPKIIALIQGGVDPENNLWALIGPFTGGKP